MSLRLRLTLWYSVALTAVLVLFGLALFGILSYLLIRQVDSNLELAARSIENSGSVISPAKRVHWLDLPLDENLSTANIVGQVWGLDGDLIVQSDFLTQRGYDQPLDAEAITLQQFSTRSVTAERWHWRVYTAVLKTTNGEPLGYLQLGATPVCGFGAKHAFAGAVRRRRRGGGAGRDDRLADGEPRAQTHQHHHADRAADLTR
ncbi:MAG: hypothetical protein ACT4QE_05910 [Anaerolineales bacterium]